LINFLQSQVILLCGPPGTGKTTLAHIAAKHCGYRVLEINASDDRSPQLLKDAISRATQNATLDADKRPNCIILDECDGIDGEILRLLVVFD
jgi:chromosome transmission fidelity protein 18